MGIYSITRDASLDRSQLDGVSSSSLKQFPLIRSSIGAWSYSDLLHFVSKTCDWNTIMSTQKHSVLPSTVVEEEHLIYDEDKSENYEDYDYGMRKKPTRRYLCWIHALLFAINAVVAISLLRQARNLNSREKEKLGMRKYELGMKCSSDYLES
jgi:hypothetical protein